MITLRSISAGEGVGGRSWVFPGLCAALSIATFVDAIANALSKFTNIDATVLWYACSIALRKNISCPSPLPFAGAVWRDPVVISPGN